MSRLSSMFRRRTAAAVWILLSLLAASLAIAPAVGAASAARPLPHAYPLAPSPSGRVVDAASRHPRGTKTSAVILRASLASRRDLGDGTLPAAQILWVAEAPRRMTRRTAISFTEPFSEQGRQETPQGEVTP